MDQASPDLLLMIFKELTSKEMVPVMRVERKWLQIIDEHKSLWRELVLPSNEKGWGLQALELFDRKSNSTLKRVSMEVGPGVESGPLIEILEKSKDTLRVLEIHGGILNSKVERALEENLLKFSNLEDCRFATAPDWYYRLRLQLQDKDNEQEDDESSGLRVLWISNSEKLLKSHLNLLDNLVSLLLHDECYDSLEMRRILERPSRTLRHLQITIEGEEEPQVPNLSFPNLTFLDFSLYNCSASVFPSWMKLSSLSILVSWNSRPLSSLPACPKLWVIGLDDFDGLSKLASQCPELVEFRMDLCDFGRGDEKLSAWERFENLSSMLSQRRANVEAGMEIEGVKMINLKTLVVSFEHVGLRGESGLEEVALSKLRELVEEVIDLRGKVSENSEIIEMEV